MYCSTKEEFLTESDQMIFQSLNSESGKKKNIMLADADGNISLFKFDELINSINKLAAAVKKNTDNGMTDGDRIKTLETSAVKNGDKINILEFENPAFFLNNCSYNDDAPCIPETTPKTRYHYVAAAPAPATDIGNQWIIKKP